MKEDVQKLPTWFRRHKPYEQKRERQNGPTSRISIAFNPTLEDLQNEEEELRNNFYVHCCDLVDNLLEESIKSVHDPALQKSIDFLCDDHESRRKCDRIDIGRGQEENDKKPAKRQRVFSTTNEAKIPHRGSLPCCILHTNSTAILDRSYLVQHFIKHSIRSKDCGAKVCLLSSQHSMEFSSSYLSQNRETVSKTVSPKMTLADLLKRFAFELLSCESATDNSNFKRETCYLWFRKRIKTVTIRECMELITHWARNTTSYDYIVLVLEVSARSLNMLHAPLIKNCCLPKSSAVAMLLQDIESISPLVMDELLRCLVHLRLKSSVPVSLLLFTCRSALEGLPSTITNGSMHQVELREYSLSLPSAIIGRLSIFYLELSVSLHPFVEG